MSRRASDIDKDIGTEHGPEELVVGANHDRVANVLLHPYFLLKPVCGQGPFGAIAQQ